MLHDHLTPGSAFEQNRSLAVHPKDSKEEGGASPRGGRELCNRAFCACFSLKAHNRDANKFILVASRGAWCKERCLLITVPQKICSRRTFLLGGKRICGLHDRGIACKVGECMLKCPPALLQEPELKFLCVKMMNLATYFDLKVVKFFQHPFTSIFRSVGMGVGVDAAVCSILSCPGNSPAFLLHPTLSY